MSVTRVRRALEIGAARCAATAALRRGILACCGLAVLLIDRCTLFERHPFALLSAYAIVAILLGRRPEGRIAVLGAVVAAFLLLPWTETFFWELATFALFFLVLLREHGRVVQRAELAEAARAEAETARAAAEAALRQRDDFLTAAGHDLRTPLTAVVGHSELLASQLAAGRDAATMRRHVAPLERAVRRLRGTVESIIDASVLQAGHALSLDRESVELGALAREVAELAAAAGPPGHGPVRVLCPAPVAIAADRLRLARVLQNLVDNALKYSAPGQEVTVAVRAWGSQTHRSDRGAGWVEIAVCDRGRGIPAAEVPHIFTQYYRASNAVRYRGGTGIGLATAKRIVEEHGGRLAVTSTEGAGTVVTVSLPRQAQPPGPQPRSHPSA